MVKALINNLTKASALALMLATSSAGAKEIDTNMAKLQAMDKITGKVSVIEAPVNAETKFGSFSIVVRACKTRPPEETPDNFAFVDVTDTQQDGKVVNIFKGWMISSSPALNAIEHPIYDVWLLQCLDGKVDKSKLLSAEELHARDEIVMEDDIAPAAANDVPSPANENLVNDGEPEDLINIQEEVTETVTEVPQAQALSESVPEQPATPPTVEPQESGMDNVTPTSGNVFESDGVYNLNDNDGKPQQLVPDEVEGVNAESAPVEVAPVPQAPVDNSAMPNTEPVQPVISEQVEATLPAQEDNGATLSIQLPEGAVANVSGSVTVDEEPDNMPAENGFNTPEEYNPEETEQTIEFDTNNSNYVPQLGI